MSFLVCGVCGTEYSPPPGGRCPGCTAPAELAAPPRRRRQPAPPAQLRGASALLLANAVLCVAHLLFLRQGSPVLIVVALLEVALATGLWMGMPVWPVLARAGVGMVLAWSQFKAGVEPVLMLTQAVLGLSLMVLAAQRIEGRAWVAAAAVPVLYAGAWLGVLFSLATASAPDTLALLRLRGELGSQPMSVLEGQAERYTLPLSGGDWLPFSAEQLREAGVDGGGFNSRLGAQVAVFVQRVPGIGRQGPEALEANVRFHLNQAMPGYQWMASREVPGPWDEGRLIHLRGRIGAARREAVLALYTWGDQLFLVEASAPAWRFKERTRELEELVSAFQYEPPPRPSLPAEVAARVKQATVLVWTPYGTGSGFIVHDGDSYFILTNHHVVRDPQGQVASSISILLPGERRGEIEARSFNANHHTDVVLLHTPGVGRDVPALPMRKAWPAQGTPVVAIGYPLGEQFRLGTTQPEPTLNPGSVLEARARLPGVYDASPILKTDLGINPGNSGGPVVDLDGAVVGMVVAGYVGSETSFVIPTEGLMHIFRYSPLPKMLDGSSPQRTPGELEAPRHPESVRDALRAATVAVTRGNQRGVGVVLQVPEGGEGLVLTVAGRAKPGDKVDVDFFPPGSPSPLTRAGTVRYTETDTGLALVEVEDFPGRPRGVPLGQPSGVKETDALLLGGYRDAGGVLTPMHRYAILTGLERAERWQHGAQAPARLRVDVGIIGRALDMGPAVDRDGALAGFVIQHTQQTNITVLAASEQVRELLVGRVRSVAARARRDGSGGCEVEFFVDAEAPLALPRTVSVALDAPAASLEEDALVPSFGPDTVLGTLERRDSTFRLSRPSCPESKLTYRLQLTSGLTVQTVEGHLPLPARALERTQSTLTLRSLDTPSRVLSGFLSWSDGGEGTGAQAPATLEAALAACTTSHTACGSVVTLGEAGAARVRAQRALKGSCLRGQASACVGWAELLGIVAATESGKSKLPSQEVQEALARGCEGGIAEACTRLGGPLLRHGGEPEWMRAVGVLRKACTLGNAEGCTGLAEALSVGHGEPVNEKLALRMYRRACRLHDADACLTAGRKLLSRVPEGRDPEAAYLALRRACVLGRNQGCLEMTRTASPPEELSNQSP